MITKHLEYEKAVDEVLSSIHREARYSHFTYIAGTDIYSAVNDACYSSLFYECDGVKKLTIFPPSLEAVKDFEGTKDYLEKFFQVPFFRTVFKLPESGFSVEDFFQNGVEVDVEVSSNQIYATIVALRGVFEGIFVADIFKELIKDFPPHVAIYGALSVRSCSKAECYLLDHPKHHSPMRFGTPISSLLETHTNYPLYPLKETGSIYKLNLKHSKKGFSNKLASLMSCSGYGPCTCSMGYKKQFDLGEEREQNFSLKEVVEELKKRLTVYMTKGEKA